jgi:pilus assembly protein CpaB
MKAKSVILIVIALACGSVAAVGATTLLEKNGKGNKSDSVQVLVAATDIRAGTPFNENNVKIQKWPKDRIPEGALKTLKELDGKYSNQHLFKGELLLKGKTRNSQDGTSIKIPHGMRVISVKVGVDEAVAGLLKPGDLVDVIVFLQRSQEIPEDTTRTILRKVTVFAVNAKTDRAVSEDGEPIAAKTVSLLLTPKHSLGVMLAEKKGSLHLSLRRPDDDTVEDVDEPQFTMAELLGQDPETPKAVEQPADNTFEEFISPQVTQPVAVAPIVKPKKQWEMVVHTPEEVSVVKWSDTDRLPDHLGSVGDQLSAPSEPTGTPTFDGSGEFSENQSSESEPSVEDLIEGNEDEFAN